MEYRYLNSDKQIQYFKISSDGEYTLPASFPTDETEVTYTNKLGFAYSTYSLKDISFTITQLPSAYEGALVFDGVDDYGICTGLPILDDYTLICKREWIDLSRKSNAAIANKRKVNQTLGGAFNFERLTISQILTLSFGNYTNIQLSSSGVVYQTKTSYNGDKVISSGSLTDTDSLFLGCSGNGIEFANCAIYYFALYNKSLTPEEIETEKERLNEEWLKRKTE